jgi:S-adenosylmethionine synthetase
MAGAEYMSRNIRVRGDGSLPTYKQDVEYVERKGIGHPDSLIDGIMERVSTDLSNAYMDAAGVILHHNVDKGLIIGGSSEARFGYGKITRPIEIILTGRATKEYQGADIPVDDIAVRAARDYLREHTRFLDIDNEVRIESKIVKGSDDLSDVFGRANDIPLANDTSFGIGFAPLTETERTVLETERMLNSKEYKGRMPAVGEDIKVMGVRDGSNITLTVAIAFVAQHVSSLDDYIRYKERVRSDIIELSKRVTRHSVEVFINNADSIDRGSVYLTKSGLSCEAGDDGSVGRGNRPNGLITPFRYMSLEAAAGKNPFNHVGKIYGVLANEIAADAVRLYPDIEECNVSIVSQIGRPINDPKHMDIRIKMKEGMKPESIAKKVEQIGDEALENIGFLTREILAGKHGLF